MNTVRLHEYQQSGKISIQTTTSLEPTDIASIESHLIKKNKFQTWIQNVIQEVKDNHVSDDLNSSSNDDIRKEPNILFGPDLEKALSDFLSRLPLFGNIMNNKFGSNNISPTSSATEQDFSVIKNDLFKKQRQIRVDTFVKTHIDFTRSRLLGKNICEKINDLCDSVGDISDNEHSNNIKVDKNDLNLSNDSNSTIELKKIESNTTDQENGEIE